MHRRSCKSLFRQNNEILLICVVIVIEFNEFSGWIIFGKLYCQLNKYQLNKHKQGKNKAGEKIVYKTFILLLPETHLHLGIGDLLCSLYLECVCPRNPVIQSLDLWLFPTVLFMSHFLGDAFPALPQLLAFFSLPQHCFGIYHIA